MEVEEVTGKHSSTKAMIGVNHSNSEAKCAPKAKLAPRSNNDIDIASRIWSWRKARGLEVKDSETTPPPAFEKFERSYSFTKHYDFVISSEKPACMYPKPMVNMFGSFEFPNGAQDCTESKAYIPNGAQCSDLYSLESEDILLLRRNLEKCALSMGVDDSGLYKKISKAEEDWFRKNGVCYSLRRFPGREPGAIDENEALDLDYHDIQKHVQDVKEGGKHDVNYKRLALSTLVPVSNLVNKQFDLNFLCDKIDCNLNLDEFRTGPKPIKNVDTTVDTKTFLEFNSTVNEKKCGEKVNDEKVSSNETQRSKSKNCKRGMIRTRKMSRRKKLEQFEHDFYAAPQFDNFLTDLFGIDDDERIDVVCAVTRMEKEAEPKETSEAQEEDLDEQMQIVSSTLIELDKNSRKSFDSLPVSANTFKISFETFKATDGVQLRQKLSARPLPLRVKERRARSRLYKAGFLAVVDQKNSTSKQNSSSKNSKCAAEFSWKGIVSSQSQKTKLAKQNIKSLVGHIVDLKMNIAHAKLNNIDCSDQASFDQYKDFIRDGASKQGWDEFVQASKVENKK